MPFSFVYTVGKEMLRVSITSGLNLVSVVERCGVKGKFPKFIQSEIVNILLIQFDLEVNNILSLSLKITGLLIEKLPRS